MNTTKQAAMIEEAAQCAGRLDYLLQQLAIAELKVGNAREGRTLAAHAVSVQYVSKDLDKELERTANGVG